MTIANKWYGAITAATATPTPATGGSFSVGDALIIFTWQDPGSSTCPLPSGWTKLDSDTNIHQVRAFGLISLTGAESMPTLAWTGGTSNRAFVACYSGVDSGFATGGGVSDRSSNVTQNLVMPAVSRTPSVDGCLCCYYGIRKKTSVSDGTTYSPPGGTGFSVPVQQNPNGGGVTFGLGEWIQTAATTIASGSIFSGSIAESVATTMETALFILKPAIIAATVNSRSLLGVGT